MMSQESYTFRNKGKSHGRNSVPVFTWGRCRDGKKPQAAPGDHLRDSPLQPANSISRLCAHLSPGFIAPMMPTLVDEPPEGEGWIHEIKHDGYRTILAVDGAATRAFTARATIGQSDISRSSRRR